VTCGTSGTAAGNPPGIFVDTWQDTSSAPTHPRQSQLAAEAVKAAKHWGNTTAASNASVQYVIATAHNNNSTGFGTQYCAWHSYTSSTAGNVAYTNLPYITDAGASCGANFNGLGPNAGITIVEGHEMGETITDQFPSTGWLDSGGAENGDKCAWISSGSGASTNITLTSGVFPVQTLWSNAANSGAGGCVISY
jgi:serine protease